MPIDPRILKEIIDSGAYAAGHVMCVNGTLSWKLSEGVEPDKEIAKRYIQAAKALQEVAEELVEDITKERGNYGGPV